jgi:hypothetical protein
VLFSLSSVQNSSSTLNKRKIEELNVEAHDYGKYFIHTHTIYDLCCFLRYYLNLF